MDRIQGARLWNWRSWGRWLMRTLVASVIAVVVGSALPRTATADTVTLGLFAPSAPFPSTAARVELASKLAEHLGIALGGAGTGRVYARAGDFAGAVKK